MPAPLPSSPKRILLIRLSAFGDVVIATGLLHALKRAYPDAEIDWLVQPEFAELLRTQTTIANVVVWDRKHWGRLWRGFRWWTLLTAIRQFAEHLNARRYDWAVDAQGLLKSRVLAKLSGARKRIGYDSKEPGKLWMHELVQRFPEAHAERRFIGDEHAPMLKALCGQTELVPQLKLSPIKDELDYLVAAPFTTRPQKHWPEAHWVSLLKSLTAEGHRVLVLGGPSDAAAAAELDRQVGSSRLENRAGQTDFLAAARLITGAKTVIGVDTGLTHLGFALGRPTVALFGSTRPYAAARDAGSAVLFQLMSCAPCGRHPSCAGRFDCLRQLTPEMVRSALTFLPRPNAL